MIRSQRSLESCMRYCPVLPEPEAMLDSAENPPCNVQYPGTSRPFFYRVQLVDRKLKALEQNDGSGQQARPQCSSRAQ